MPSLSRWDKGLAQFAAAQNLSAPGHLHLFIARSRSALVREMENKTDDLFLGSLTDDAIDIEQESFLTPSDDEDEVINDDFYIPEPVSDGNNNDPTQILISTDASCNIRTSAGCCVIINDITFGTQMRSLPHVSTDSFVAELSTMTEAVKWGTQLVREARSLGHNQIETLHVVSDCQDAVEWWNTA